MLGRRGARWSARSRDTCGHRGVSAQLRGRERLVWAVARAPGGMRSEGDSSGRLGLRPTPVAASLSSSVCPSHLHRGVWAGGSLS